MDRLNDSLISHQISVINNNDDFEELFKEHDVSEFAYTNDGHFNAKGYAFFASTIIQGIDEQQLLNN